MQRSRRSPLWAKLLVIAGAVLLFTSGTAIAGVTYALDRLDDAIEQQDLFGEINTAEEFVTSIEGPLTVLLVGLDTRPTRPHDVPLADSVIIVHIPEGLDHGYLISLPRDTLVDIPPFEATGYLGGRGRLNSAMSIGARQLPGEELPDVARGFQLLSRTVSDLTGIERFDAGAVINFTGFTDVVNALGGITVDLEERIVSLHRRPDGLHREVNWGGEGYFGPQMVYEPGTPPCGQARLDGSFTCNLNGWQSLDIARQRYGVDGSDYGRQRNQQLIIRAMAEKALSRDIVTNPIALNDLLNAVEGSLVFDGRGHRPLDFGFAMRNLRPGDLVSVRLAAENLGTGSFYRGEQLLPQSLELFEALRAGTLEEFLLAHPDFIG